MLGNLLKGKNIELFLKKNRVAYTSVPGRNPKKGLISKFEVSPLKTQAARSQNTLICDRDVISILETSYQTLTFCNLVSCMFITSNTFKTIAKATCLQWLCISNNQHFSDSCAIEIIQNCQGMLHLNFSRCSNLTEKTTDAIVDGLLRLETLDVSHNTPMVADFRNTEKLKGMTQLHELDISFCLFGDSKLVSLCKFLPALEVLSLECCPRISIEGVQEVLLNQQNSLRRVVLTKTEPTKINQTELRHIEEKRPELELVYHRD